MFTEFLKDLTRSLQTFRYCTSVCQWFWIYFCFSWSHDESVIHSAAKGWKTFFRYPPNPPCVVDWDASAHLVAISMGLQWFLQSMAAFGWQQFTSDVRMYNSGCFPACAADDSDKMRGNFHRRDKSCE